ncbi:MauE/DoxX family redox-associated membrane protein [Actinoplanes sp. N902-109]|uniref:MauE/DoxX family redox-associated membrane protein n=1 Tax=Actinoplanes sp. (strain N902-109) TaxID=649831 RepID=UPI0003295E32|nr:MauE/DoxX family redox-associated membrane protein [Actinoplanes sp. N902-109]AGL17625.1 hypothetical protein L083_4115 [Actinoplanes sp. N902-109]
MLQSAVTAALQLYLGLTLAGAAMAKLMSGTVVLPSLARRPALEKVFRAGLIGAELSVGAGLFIGAFPRAAALAALVLFTGFLSYRSFLRRTVGAGAQCYCGGAASTVDTAATTASIIQFLLSAALLAVGAGHGNSPSAFRVVAGVTVVAAYCTAAVVIRRGRMRHAG